MTTAAISDVQEHATDRSTHSVTNVARVAAPRPDAISRGAVWTGRVLTGLATVFFAFDATVKVLLAGPAVEGSARFGLSPGALRGIGVIELACLAVYLFPRTAPLGAVLWTGYLGGAIATHVRAGDPLLTHTLFPIYVAALIWASVYLRDGRVRALLDRRALRA
jgi:hypothetical protein